MPAGQAWGPVISAWQYLGGEVPPHEAAAESGEQPNGEAGDGLPDVQAALATVVAQLRTMAAPGRAEAYRHACSMYVLHPVSTSSFQPWLVICVSEPQHWLLMPGSAACPFISGVQPQL